ncbi:MAG: 50S ribosomal protein L31e [Candidatus Nitrosocaldus sp.]
MSSEGVEERVYTINLGRVVLAPDNRRSKRAINMIREFAMRHMKSEEVIIDEELNELVWARGIRSPPRRVRVLISKDASGIITVKPYKQEEVSRKGEEEEEEKKTGEKKKEEEGSTTTDAKSEG